MSTRGDAPGPNDNLADLLRWAAAEFPDRPAVISSTGAVTWAQLDRAADRGSAALTSLQLDRGARVVVSLPTGPNIIASMFAVARAGLVAAPVAPSRSGLVDTVATVGASCTIGDQPAVDGLPRLSDSDVQSWWADGATSRVDAIGGGEDLALLARAGTDDRPVMISHRAILAAVRAIGQAPSLALRTTDRVLLVLPLYHPAGWVTAFLPLCLVGGAAVVPDLPDQRGQWIDRVLAAVRGLRVTVIPAAPSLYRRLPAAPDAERALASVRLMTSGASPLDPSDFTAIRRLTGQPVWEGYGIAESASAVATSLMTRAPHLGSVGLPLPGVELRILGDDEKVGGDRDPGADAADEPDDEFAADAAPAESTGGGSRASYDEIIAEVPGDGEVGRIAIRGATLFSGYWPDGADGPDEDGWFDTDDVGHLDDNGELHLVDRAGESLIVAGFRVYPREVEDVLATHPYVRDAAVIGVPGRTGEMVMAVLVAQRGTRPTPEDLDDFLATRLPAFKRPARYRLVDRLPRSEVGRVDRDAVRREYLADPDPVDVSPVRLAAGQSGSRLPDSKRDRIARPPRDRRPTGAAGGDADEELF